MYKYYYNRVPATPLIDLTYVTKDQIKILINILKMPVTYKLGLTKYMMYMTHDLNLAFYLYYNLGKSVLFIDKTNYYTSYIPRDAKYLNIVNPPRTDEDTEMDVIRLADELVKEGRKIRIIKLKDDSFLSNNWDSGLAHFNDLFDKLVAETNIMQYAWEGAADEKSDYEQLFE